MLLEITVLVLVLSQIKPILSRFGSVYSQPAPRPMLLATVAIACLGDYIYRAAIVVRLFIIYPLSPNLRQYLISG